MINGPDPVPKCAAKSRVMQMRERAVVVRSGQSGLLSLFQMRATLPPCGRLKRPQRGAMYYVVYRLTDALGRLFCLCLCVKKVHIFSDQWLGIMSGPQGLSCGEGGGGGGVSRGSDGYYVARGHTTAIAG